jgi:hypothetical protein
MKSNLPLRVDQNTTLVDVKYDRTHSTYWYVIDSPTNLTLKRQREFPSKVSPVPNKTYAVETSFAFYR